MGNETIDIKKETTPSEPVKDELDQVVEELFPDIETEHIDNLTIYRQSKKANN